MVLSEAGVEVSLICCTAPQTEKKLWKLKPPPKKNEKFKKVMEQWRNQWS